MNILAIDTSSDHGSAVVQIGGNLAAEVRRETSMQHSEHLFGSIDDLLARSHISLEDVDVFAAIRGPGSFTGLRVGLAAIEGFAFATGKEAVGMSALAGLAWQAGEVDGPIAPVLDARRGEVYAAVFERRGQELVEVFPPAVLQPAQWFEAVSGAAVVVRLGGGPLDPSLIESRCARPAIEASPYLASTLARMVDAGNREPPEPLYIRRTSAELNRLKAT